jgi:diaminopimelate epimerase
MSNDGPHYAKIKHDLVHLKMGDVSQIEKRENDWFIHTGSPHYISVVDNVDQLDIIPAAQKIRHNPEFTQNGVNVNFIECGEQIKIRTYERGVENETLSCGTGATAAAIANFLISNTSQKTAIYSLQTQGGLLKVSFEKVDNGFENVYLIGPATHVFDGNVTLP